MADRRDSWSWTDSRDVARTYAAGGFGGRRPGAIWTALVDPDRLLARNRDRDEFEYVVDTTGLTIEPARAAQPSPTPRNEDTSGNPEPDQRSLHG
ncbi:hypothetical protein AB0L41_30200 [Amycolatopsis mediterranei]|uniref:hypothetical protein n=1 Tax=Amycolatopsis mediterranei TaxID=33910 RepID=UPI003443FA61